VGGELEQPLREGILNGGGSVAPLRQNRGKGEGSGVRTWCAKGRSRGRRALSKGGEGPVPARAQTR
jgi:hypothetical protein